LATQRISLRCEASHALKRAPGRLILDALCDDVYVKAPPNFDRRLDDRDASRINRELTD